MVFKMYKVCLSVLLLTSIIANAAPLPCTAQDVSAMEKRGGGNGTDKLFYGEVNLCAKGQYSDAKQR